MIVSTPLCCALLHCCAVLPSGLTSVHCILSNHLLVCPFSHASSFLFLLFLVPSFLVSVFSLQPVTARAHLHFLMDEMQCHTHSKHPFQPFIHLLSHPSQISVPLYDPLGVLSHNSVHDYSVCAAQGIPYVGTCNEAWRCACCTHGDQPPQLYQKSTLGPLQPHHHFTARTLATRRQPRGIQPCAARVHGHKFQ